MRLGRYVLGDLLGEGAAAHVYAAKDDRGHEVAIKRMRRSASEDPIGAARLTREAELLASIDHDGLVRVIEIGQDDDGRSFLVLERVRGRSLRERIEKDGPCNEREAWRIVRGVATALSAAHGAGVLHRDLTTSNVLLDEKDRPKLGDFGLARRASDPRLSREGASTGTPAYMAPEQWWGAAIDERTDVYGLGAILYECLTGEPPWQGEPADILHRIATGEPPSVADRARVAPEVAAFVRRAMKREPRDRPADARAFVAEGDRAFGYAKRRVPYVPLATIAILTAIPIALGYGGTHDPREWMRESGWGGFSVIAMAVLGAWLATRLRTLRPIAASAPMMAGALTFFTGMQVVASAIGSIPPEEQFAVFHLGLAEASAGWFLGAALAAVLLGATATWPSAADERVLVRPDLRAILSALACVALAVFAAEPGAIAALGVAAIAILVGAPARGPDAALSSLAAVGAVGLVAWVRIVSESARLWSSGMPIAERARELTRLDAEGSTVWIVTLASLVAVAIAGRWRGVRAWSRSRVMMLAITALAVALALVVPWISSQRDRRALWDEVAPHFSVWSELDPPEGSGDRAARIGPTLQLGRHRVAVDGENVAPIAALEGNGEMGPLLVADRLGPSLELTDDRAELVLAADRSLRYYVVERALMAAYELGVRRVDVVQLPGRPIAIDPRAPPEAHVVLPGDLRAFEVRLRAGPEPSFGPEQRFDRVVRALFASRDRSLVLTAR